jgi:hypothetical protein
MPNPTFGNELLPCKCCGKDTFVRYRDVPLCGMCYWVDSNQAKIDRELAEKLKSELFGQNRAALGCVA